MQQTQVSVTVQQTMESKTNMMSHTYNVQLTAGARESYEKAIIMNIYKKGYPVKYLILLVQKKHKIILSIHAETKLDCNQMDQSV